MNRLNGWDRFFRFLLGIVALQAALFWLSGLGQVLVYAAAVAGCDGAAISIF